MTALTGNPAFFQTALADALDIEFSIAAHHDVCGYSSLIAALKSVGLNDEQAYLVTSAIYPTFFSNT